MKKILPIFLGFVVMCAVMGSCDDNHKGENRCTICGSRNIYYNSGSYAYCQEHFNDMVNYGK